MSTRAGIEVDGTHATVVLAHGSGDALAVESVHTVTGDTIETLLAAAMSHLRVGDQVRVALRSPAVACATIEGSTDLLTRSRFTRAAHTATGVSTGVAVAGYVADPDAARDGRLSTALAATAPADVVARIHNALRDRHQVEVVVPALAHAPVEGASLALGHSSSELVLVVDGAPVAARTLRAGGLDALRALLAGDAERLDTALRRGGADPIAAAEADRWVRAVAQETATILGDFARRGLRVDTAVFVHGPGAVAADLPPALADAGVRTHTHKVLASLPGAPATRPPAVTAYLAAATHGTGLPHAAFVDAAQVAAARRAAERTRRRRTYATAAACAGMLGAALLGPAGYATVQDVLAARHATKVTADVHADPARATAYQVGVLTAVRDQVTGASTANAHILTAALAGAAGTVELTDLAVTAGSSTRGGAGQVTATGTATDMDHIRAFSDAVRASLGKDKARAHVTLERVARTSRALSFTATITTAADTTAADTTADTEPTGGAR